MAAVIAPWNFPLAISCGISAAAIAAGNCVLYKPSGLSPVVGFTLAEIFKEAGLPKGVFNYTPGRGSLIGDYLVDHPDISLIAFTGSMDIGLRILERASDDTDLDEAVVHLLHSAFGFQGQKCSACSRAIVLEPIYHRFVSRLVEAAKSVQIDPAPVSDEDGLI